MIELIKTFIFIILMIFFILKYVSSQPKGDWKKWKYELQCSKQIDSCVTIRYLLAYLEIEFIDTRLSERETQKPVLYINGLRLTQPMAIIRLIAKLARFYGENWNNELLINIVADNILDLQRDIIDYKKKDFPCKLKELELSLGNDDYLINNKFSLADILFAGIISYLNHHVCYNILRCYPKLMGLYNKVLEKNTIKNWLKKSCYTNQYVSNTKDIKSEITKCQYGIKKLGESLLSICLIGHENETDKPSYLTEEMFSFTMGTKTPDLDIYHSSMNAATYQILDFNLPGLGEIITCILHYLDKEFTVIRVNNEQWLELEDRVPFGKLPLLKINNKIVLNQTIAIARYFAIIANLNGNNAWETMLINIAVDEISELQMAIAPYYVQPDPDITNRIKNDMENKTILLLSSLNARIGVTGYFVNKKLSMADIYLVTTIKLLNYILNYDIIGENGKYPLIQLLIANVVNVKKLKLRLHESIVTMT